MTPEWHFRSHLFMRMPCPWDDVYAAVERGDVAVLDESFHRQQVRQEIDAMEAVVAAIPRVDVSKDREQSQELFDSGFYKRMNLFVNAATHNRIEVLEWFYSPVRLAYMRAMLTLLLVSISECAVLRNKPDVLEFLLASSAWSELLTETQQQTILNELPRSLSREPSEVLIQILLAHGMDVNDEPLLRTCVELLTPSQIDVFVAGGTRIVGADTLWSCGYYTNASSTQRLIHHGADASGPALYSAVSWEVSYPVIRILVKHGFADVDHQYMKGFKQGFEPLTEGDLETMDERFFQGKTPLMAAVAKGFDHFGCPCRDTILMTRMLLKHGADVTLRDDAGKTALHHASDNVEIIKMLLVRGADPNARSRRGELVRDWESFSTLQERDIATIPLLLKYGFDPFVVGWWGKSTLERLQEDERGAELVAAHPEYFSPPPSEQLHTQE